MTDKLQLVLINVLLDQFLNTKVSQGSVATGLRCDEIFNDQFITQSLPSPRLKKMKISQHLPKLWAIKYWVVFMKHGVYHVTSEVGEQNESLKLKSLHLLELQSIALTICKRDCPRLWQLVGIRQMRYCFTMGICCLHS